MKDIDPIGIALKCSMIGLFFCLTLALGNAVGKHAVHKQAVEAGAGRWAIDATSGEKRFEWTTATEGKR